jgi:hypothetical protein
MHWRKIKDRIAGKSMLLSVAFANSIVLLIALGLFINSMPILSKKIDPQLVDLGNMHQAACLLADGRLSP